MKSYFPILILLFISINSILFGQTQSNYTYFQNDTFKLQMDVFSSEDADNVLKPVVIFAHGGGFSKGNRQAGYGFCSYMAKHGYIACTIDYSLYMKNGSFSCDGITSEKIKAIQIAANDICLATSFLLSKSEELKIDTCNIFISGSRAGAEASLHAAYMSPVKYSLNNLKLPQNFKYGGVIAGAGALRY